MSVPDLPDRRSLGMLGVPYSAYCKICWQAMFGSVIGIHDGICKNIKKGETQCENAKNWMKIMLEIKKS